MILIQGDRVIGSAEGIDMKVNVVLDGGQIVEIIPARQQTVERQTAGREASHDYECVMDVNSMIVTPGLVDIHVYFRDLGLTCEENIHIDTKVAAKSGFTTVICMADTELTIDNEETFRYVLEEGEKTGIYVFSCAAISKGFNGRDMTGMGGPLAAGVVGFIDDGIPLMEGNFVRVAMEKAARLDTVLSFHEEDKVFIKESRTNHDRVSDQLGVHGSPALIEDSLVVRDCMIALDARAVMGIQHISSDHSTEIARLAKKSGAKMQAEVTSHHSTLAEDAVLKHDTSTEMNPLLRIEENRQVLIQGPKDGTTGMIATDHTPHSKEEKDRSLTAAPNGIPGLETVLALGVTSLARPGRPTMIQLMGKMSNNPARLYRLDCGQMETGILADLVIFDENRQRTVKGFGSKPPNSPFLGEALTGQIVYTVCRGAIVYGDGG